jgi:hypothetical protein
MAARMSRAAPGKDQTSMGRRVRLDLIQLAASDAMESTFRLFSTHAQSVAIRSLSTSSAAPPRIAQ